MSGWSKTKGHYGNKENIRVGHERKGKNKLKQYKS